MNKNYYKAQFKLINQDPHTSFGYFPSIKLFDNRGNETKQISLNLESISLLIDELKKLENQLINQNKG